MYTLLVTKGPDVGLSYEIRSGRATVGRSPECALTLTDSAVHEHHFMVLFDEGSWKAVTYSPQASIMIDRRWQDPESGKPGALILVGDSQLLLVSGQINHQSAMDSAENLDFDAETLRDDAVSQVRNKAMEFSADMTGKGRPASRGKNQPNLQSLVSLASKSIFDTAPSCMPGTSKELAVLHNAEGEFARQIYGLVAQLDNARLHRGVQRILVTSAEVGTGKTVCATNLALAMSEGSARKISLVEGNLRKPRLQQLFKISHSSGWSDLLQAAKKLEETVARILGRSLVVLHSPQILSHADSLIPAPAWKQNLDELHQAGDFLIIDGPPALPYPDASLLAAQVDAVIIVASKARTQRSSLEQAIRTLGTDKLLGVVFHDTAS